MVVMCDHQLQLSGNNQIVAYCPIVSDLLVCSKLKLLELGTKDKQRRILAAKMIRFGVKILSIMCESCNGLTIQPSLPTRGICFVPYT